METEYSFSSAAGPVAPASGARCTAPETTSAIGAIARAIAAQGCRSTRGGDGGWVISAWGNDMTVPALRHLGFQKLIANERLATDTGYVAAPADSAPVTSSVRSISIPALMSTLGLSPNVSRKVVLR